MSEATARAAGQGRAGASALTGDGDTPDDVLALPGGGDADAHVPRPGRAPRPAGRTAVEAEVVADRGERGCSVVSASAGIGRAVACLAHRQLGREMLGIGGVPPLPKKTSLPPPGTASCAEPHQPAGTAA